MSIQKEFVVRYREDGHVRFQFPAQLCDKVIAERISAGIANIEGVYRVKVYRSQQKLSIRYHEVVCDFKALARQLFDLLAELEQQGALMPQPETRVTQWKDKLNAKLDTFKLTRWTKEKVGEVKETVQAAKDLTKLGMKKPKAFVKDPEKAIIDFLNDILVLFLIRLHWGEITQNWLVKPLKYRYEWMALFYMFFLLVRSRKQK